MPRLSLQTFLLTRLLDDDSVLSEALLFPEVSRWGFKPEKRRGAVDNNSIKLAEETSLDEFFQRCAPTKLTVQSFEVTLEPTKKQNRFSSPIVLTFHAAVRAYTRAAVAYFPALQLEVIGADQAELEQNIPRQIKLALQRMNATRDVQELVHLQRDIELTIDVSRIEPDILTAKQWATRKENEDKKSALAAVGHKLDGATLRQAHDVALFVQHLADALGQPRPQSVLLIGPSGVGKTALFHELVRQRDTLGFGSTPFWASSGSRLVAGTAGFGMWQQRCDAMRREASKTRSILHLGNLIELLESGKGEMIQQGVGGYLQPAIARGELVCVLEATPEQLPIIEKLDPHLLSCLRQLDLKEPDLQLGQRIINKVASEVSSKTDRKALDTLNRLHRRYATYSAFPGRPVRFLKNLMNDVGNDFKSADVFSAFSRETGLPRHILDSDIAWKLDQVQKFFNDRIMGQPQALELLVDMLATVKSGLARPGKPLSSFLFVGPTGVGKTETCKALAEYLFKDRNRMIRFDMSEYANPVAVQRLIGGASGEGLLTSRVREQPFSVLLFDEFEKANAAFFDLLLQVLGEARLTDEAGRIADFRNTVIVMTSNLGAEAFMQGSMGFGESGGQQNPAQHFTAALQKFVRPELLNRIDRVVPFMPLSQECIQQILVRELELLEKRPGMVDTGTSLDVSIDALLSIAKGAHKPELGARPLKRAMEQQLLAPLAEELNTRPIVYSLNVRADVEAKGIGLSAEPKRDNDNRVLSRVDSDPQRKAFTQEVTVLRRKTQVAAKSPALMELKNQLYRDQKALKKWALKRKRKPSEQVNQKVAEFERNITRLLNVTQSFKGVSDAVQQVEDLLMLANLGLGEQVMPDPEAIELLHAEWLQSLLKLSRMSTDGTNIACLGIRSANNKCSFQLARAYVDFFAAERPDANLRLYWHSQNLPPFLGRELAFQPNNADVQRILKSFDQSGFSVNDSIKIPVRDIKAFLSNPPDQLGELLFYIGSTDIFLLLKLEDGRHVFDFGEVQLHPVDVSVKVRNVNPNVWEKAESLASELRREYNMGSRRAMDSLLGKTVVWTGSKLETVLKKCLPAAYLRALEKQVGL
ncbi:MAG: AAA family ATPase [Planctomycetes bacterium]|nr:AAA family ATPase [Planctomycetota bacterium]